ncbi:hypothetical protein C8F04DRAFT_1271138 [Mycena alexandri]|uniref:Uncharacterized protein n=1 Tax=Mycena alexandri TaxID=1745969 RepID=A0AAD6SA10_9AGAR|nr:hypothetical protein C8F04DRAFT_1271138 [Mycena alexandri]
MQLFAALFASFLAVAVANVGILFLSVSLLPSLTMTQPMAAREPSGVVHCDLGPFLSCEGGIDQQIACGDDWQCPGNGLHPIIADPYCAAHCVCEIPCP